MIEQAKDNIEQPAEEPKVEFSVRDMAKSFFLLLQKAPQSILNGPEGSVILPPQSMATTRAQLDSLPDDVADKFQIDIDDKGIIVISLKKKRKRGLIAKPRKSIILPN